MKKDLSDQLLASIDSGSFHDLQKATQPRDKLGNTIAPINDIPQATALHKILFRSEGHNARWNLRHDTQQTTRNLVQVILDLRNKAHDPCPDLNIHHVNAGTALVTAIDADDLYLIQQLLDTRMANGDPAVDIMASGKPGEFWSPLTRALFRDNLQVTQFLVDARNGDGSYVLDRNTLQASLDGAHCNGGHRTVDNNTTRWLKNHLQNLPYVDAPRNQNNIAAPIANTTQTGNSQENQFAQNKQSTHTTAVSRSVEISVHELHNRYQNQLTPQKQLNELHTHITKYYSGKQLDAALATLKRVQNETSIRNNIELTASEVLSLVWLGVTDKKGCVVENQRFNDIDIRARQRILIDNLIRIQNTYGENSPMCFVGMLNKIVETLDNIHPDVTIAMGTHTILTVAIARTMVLFSKYFREKNFFEQREILTSYDQDDTTTTAANIFRTHIRTKIEKQLLNDFQTTLTKQQLDDILDNIKYINRPVTHTELDQLIQHIEAMQCNFALNKTAQVNFDALKRQAQNAYLPSNKSFEDEFQDLQKQYHKTLKLIYKPLILAANKVLQRFFVLGHSQAKAQFRQLKHKLKLNLKQNKSIDLDETINELQNKTICAESKDFVKKAIICILAAITVIPLIAASIYYAAQKNKNPSFSFFPKPQKEFNQAVQTFKSSVQGTKP